MKIMNLTKLTATSVALIGLLAGCAGSETKDEAAAEQPAAEQSAAATDEAAATDSAAMQSSTEESTMANEAMTASDSYEVVKGDNLWNISGKSDIYGDSYQWPLIYKANRDSIKDADLIYSGQVLNIDRAASQADIDAAITHAKTRGAWTLGAQEDSDKAYLGE